MIVALFPIWEQATSTPTTRQGSVPKLRTKAGCHTHLVTLTRKDELTYTLNFYLPQEILAINLPLYASGSGQINLQGIGGTRSTGVI